MMAEGAEYNTHIAKIPAWVFEEDKMVPRELQAAVRFTHDRDGEIFSVSFDDKMIGFSWGAVEELIREARASYVEVEE